MADPNRTHKDAPLDMIVVAGCTVGMPNSMYICDGCNRYYLFPGWVTNPRCPWDHFILKEVIDDSG